MTDRDSGFTLIELLIVVAIIGVISAIAVPGLLRARQSGNEASALASLQVINTVQQQFAEVCGAFSPSLDGLSLKPAKDAPPFITADLGTNGITKSGYAFRVEPLAESQPTDSPKCPTTVTSRYVAYADPVGLKTSEAHYYATDEQHAIRMSSLPIPNPIPETLAMVSK